jgi:peptide deformylase
MSSLEIRKYPDPVLRRSSAAVEVEELNDSLRNLIDNMLEAMYIFKGVGLAAPQVGVLTQVVTIDIGQGPISLINPQVIETEGGDIAEEGCLSIPDVYLEIKRGKKIAVTGIDLKGKEITLEAEGLLARVIQHEIDHLKGVLILDRIPSLEREMIISKLKKSWKKKGGELM